MTIFPMFPLSMVVFPGTKFTLRVFEYRYLELVEYCLETGESFGVCLIERGHEVGGGDQRHEYGTLSKIEQMVETGDGKLAISCIGEKRFRVLDWLLDDPYPKADIEIGEVAETGLISRQRLDEIEIIESEIAKTISELSGKQIGRTTPKNSNVIEELYNIADRSFLGAYDKYRILSSHNLEARFELLRQLLHETYEIYRRELNLRNRPD